MVLVQCTSTFETGPRLYSGKELASDYPSPHLVSKSYPSRITVVMTERQVQQKLQRSDSLSPSPPTQHTSTAHRDAPQRHWAKGPSTNEAQKSKEPFLS